MGKKVRKAAKKSGVSSASQNELLERVLDTEALVDVGARGALHHGRSLPLPLRVKSGSFSDECFCVETASKSFQVPWKDVKIVYLGFVNERQDTEATAYVTEKMVGDMGRAIKGGKSDDGKIVSFKESQVLDVLVEGVDEPLRFEAGNINYRSFLPQISYISFQNFFRLVHTFVSRAKWAHFNENVARFLVWDRLQIKRCAAFYEHDEAVATSLEKISTLLTWDDLDLSRDSWMQEWSE